MDCLGTYFTHAQTCNVTRVQSAMQWTASVHTLHMSIPVLLVVFVVVVVVVVVVKQHVYFPCMCHTYFTYIPHTYFGSSEKRLHQGKG